MDVSKEAALKASKMFNGCRLEYGMKLDHEMIHWFNIMFEYINQSQIIQGEDRAKDRAISEIRHALAFTKPNESKSDLIHQIFNALNKEGE